MPVPRFRSAATASRLSPGKVPLQRVQVSKDEILRLLSFFIEMLNGINDQRGEALALSHKREELKSNLLRTKNSDLSFQDLSNAHSRSFVRYPSP